MAQRYWLYTVKTSKTHGALMQPFLNYLHYSLNLQRPTQTLRVHFGFTEDVLVSKDKAFQQRWLSRIANGETVGSAWSEGGKESIDQFETHLYRDSDGKFALKAKILHHREPICRLGGCWGNRFKRRVWLSCCSP